MRRDVSIYLDGLRALAAFVVFLAHIRDYEVAAPEIARWIPAVGHDAVIVFFVLSGFVIAFTTDTRHRTLGDYVATRAARLYSVAFPVLLLTYVLAAIGTHLDVPAYVDVYQLDKPQVYVPFHLLFLGEIWTMSEQPIGNVPYWSLGYEAWYYALFAALSFYRGGRRVLLGTLLFVFIGYKLWLLLPIWLAGTWLYRHRERWAMSKGLARGLMVATFAGYVGYKLTGLEETLVTLGNAPFGGYDVTPLGSAQRWLHDWVVGVFVVVHLHALGHAQLSFREMPARVIRWCASFTFTLYLLHAPLLTFATGVLPYDPTNLLHIIGFAVLVLACVVGVGMLTEHRKRPYRRLFDRVGEAVGSVVARWSGFAFLRPTPR